MSYCKLSGMVTEADWQHWQPADMTPYLDVAFECFGPERLMIGSDWPVCTVAASYARTMQLVKDYLGRHTGTGAGGGPGRERATILEVEVAAGAGK